MSVSSSGSSTQELGYLNTAQSLATLMGTTDTAFTSVSAPLTLSGLASGLNTAEIVADLMQANEQPQEKLVSQLNQASTVLAAYQNVSSDVTTLQSTADTLESPSGWQAWIPNSSTDDATATVSPGAIGGSITFSVDSLAQADSEISAGSVSSQTAQVTSGPLLVAVGGGALGIGTLASSNLAVGNHTIAVTQASAGASLTAPSAPGASTTITTGSSDTLTYDLDGTAESLTIPAGTYTPATLAAAVQTASGGQLTAAVNSAGDLVVGTTAQGSGTSLQITGGDAATALGFSATPSATATGTDGIVTVDGVANDLTNFSPGQAVTLNGADGATVSATFTGPLTVGSLSAAEVNTGNGSLQSVVSAINGAGLGISASAVTTGTNEYRLSVQSTSSGAANTLNIATNAFSGLGALTTVTAAADAAITVGNGPGSFEVTNSSNSITGLMPGVTLNLLQADPGIQTTISLQPDGQTMADTVQSLVTAANQLITDLNTATAYTPSSTSSGSSSTAGTAGPLLGDPTAQSLLASVLSAIGDQAGVSSSGSSGLVGISMNENGTLSFNANTFAQAYDTNPTQVANTFLTGGSSSSSLMSFYESTDATAVGNYQVNVTQAASQAADTGAAVTGGAVTTAETLTVGSGGTSANYTTTAGESLEDIVTGLNQAFAAQNLAMNASVVDGALVLNSMAYGSASSFTVTSTASGAGTTGLASATNTPQTFTGTDVQGTINGQAATGTGQLLLGAANTSAQGLLVLVNATPTQLAANEGTVNGTINYQPGIAQALATVAYGAANPGTGTVANAITGEQSEMSNINTQITNWNPILQEQQTQLQNQYDAMETSLAALKTTQTALTEYFNQATSSSSSG
jgi:flagellar hook-associated protein 2